MNVNQYEHKGIKFMCREDHSDHKTFKEVLVQNAYEKKGFKIEADENWIDLGGNVGAFSVLASSRGATVACFEPDPAKVAMIETNCGTNGYDSVVVSQSAIVHTDQKHAMMNLWPKGQSWRNSLVRNKKGTEQIAVPCKNFFDIVKPTDCVKMDIEGSEIPILEAWPEDFKCKKLVFEWSFDVDKSTLRLARVLDKLEKVFDNVLYSSQIRRIKSWDFFPPCTMVHCYQNPVILRKN